MEYTGMYGITGRKRAFQTKRSKLKVTLPSHIYKVFELDIVNTYTFFRCMFSDSTFQQCSLNFERALHTDGNSFFFFLTALGLN